MATVEAIRASAVRSLIPPPRLVLSEWIERSVVLPDGVSAQPGPVRLWAFQREIADAIGDPFIERVTLVKPVRVGFTTLLTSALASFVVNDPSPILCVLPVDSDCRDYMVSDVEPIFGATPAVAGALSDDQPEGERNTILSKRFPGGSLKVVAAKSPRNLRRHNVRVLFLDEVDGMEMTPEGSPVLLAEKRTLSFPDRKIVMGSTPVREDTSHVLAAYAQSDQRVYEVPCPECGDHSVIAWPDIVWEPDRPDTAKWRCPSCKVLIDERHKLWMVNSGRWRATRPEVKGHAGFRFNALVSLHANASWGKLAAEFLAAKETPENLQTFVNTILGEGWRGEGDELSDDDLADAREDFGLDRVPAYILTLTVGCDVQHDRIEVTYLGWDEDGCMFVMAHRVVWGQWDADDTWRELDDLLKETFPHELGGRIGIDAAAIDSGDGTVTNAVMGFCGPRSRRKVMAIKGAPGMSRPVMERSKGKLKLWIVGVDTAKRQLFARLSRRSGIRFSRDVPRVWFEQVASERQVTRMQRGKPILSFERIAGKRAEALDCLVYARAARDVVDNNWDAKRGRLSTPVEQVAAPGTRKAPSQGDAAPWINVGDDWL